MRASGQGKEQGIVAPHYYDYADFVGVTESRFLPHPGTPETQEYAMLGSTVSCGQDLVRGSARDVECHLTAGRYGPRASVGMRSCRGVPDWID